MFRCGRVSEAREPARIGPPAQHLGEESDTLPSPSPVADSGGSWREGQDQDWSVAGDIGPVRAAVRPYSGGISVIHIPTYVVTRRIGADRAAASERFVKEGLLKQVSRRE